jgi:hypothetical protein
MSRFDGPFCLHRQRKIALVVCLFFTYLSFRQIVHLVEPTRSLPLIHGSLQIPSLMIFAGMIFAVGIFREVKCQPERVVLGLVVVESFSAIAAIFVASPLFVTTYRVVSVGTRLACAAITGVLTFRSHKDELPE